MYVSSYIFKYVLSSVASLYIRYPPNNSNSHLITHQSLFPKISWIHWFSSFFSWTSRDKDPTFHLRNFSLLISPTPMSSYFQCLSQTNRSPVVCPKIQFNVFYYSSLNPKVMLSLTVRSSSDSFFLSRICHHWVSFSMSMFQSVLVLCPILPSLGIYSALCFAPYHLYCGSADSLYKGQVVSIFSLGATEALCQLLSTVTSAPERLWVIHTWMSMAVFQRSSVCGCQNLNWI